MLDLADVIVKQVKFYDVTVICDYQYSRKDYISFWNLTISTKFLAKFNFNVSEKEEKSI